MKPSGNTILITGGGSGIGRELARELHRADNTVIVAGRRIAALEETAAGHSGMATMALDVADAQAIVDFAARIIAEYPSLNVLINNAGIMRFEDKIDLAAAEAMISTNLLGPIRLTSALLPHLLAQPQATLVNVSSSLAFVPVIFSPTYCATKAALHSWSVSLRTQLRDTSVEVIEIIPPGVQTEFSPGQSKSPMLMPLDAFIAETMSMLRQQPTPKEISGERAEFMRGVVDHARFDQVLRQLNMLG
jgi:uncharacterized oxidoreductase